MKKNTKECPELGRAVFDSALDGFLIADQKTKKFIAANPAICKMLGYSEQELLKLSVFDIHPKESLAHTLLMFKRQFKGEIDLAKNIPVKKKNGSIFFADIKSNAISFKGHHCLLGVFRDVSDRNEEEEKFRNIFDNTNDAVVVHDLKGNILEVNNVFLKRLNYTKKEFLQLSPSKVDAPEFRSSIPGRIKEVLRSGSALFESVHLTKEGQELNVEVNAKLIKFNGKKAILSSCRDITERKKMLKILEESETRFKELFENMAECVVIYEVKNKGQQIIIKDLNRVAEEVEKVHKKNVVGKRVDLVFPGVKAFGLYDVFKKVWKTGVPVQHPISFYKDKLHQGWRDNLVYKLPGGEVVAIYSDVTDKKEAAQNILDSATRYRQLFETSRDAVMTLEPPTWRFTSGNQNTLKLFGAKTEKEFLAQAPWILSPKLQPDGQFSDQKAHKMIMLAMKTGSNLFDWTHKTIQGKEFLAEVFLSRVEYQNKCFLQAIVRDVTKKRSQAEKLNESLYFLEQAESMSNLGSYVLDVKSGQWMSSKMLNRIFGISDKKAHSIDFWLKLIYQKDRKMMRDYFANEVLAQHKSFNKEYRIVRKNDKKVRWVHGIGKLIFNKYKEPIQMIGSIQDITEQKEAAFALATNNRFLRMISASNQCLIHSTSEEELLNQICRIIIEYGGYRLVWVGQKNCGSAKMIEVAAAAGTEVDYLDDLKRIWVRMPRGCGPSGVAIRRGKVCVVNDIQKKAHKQPWGKAALQHGFYSSIALPILAENKIIGMLAIYSEKRNAFSSKEVVLLKELVDDLSFGITVLKRKKENEKNQSRFVAIFKESPIPIFLVGLDGYFISVNKAVSKMLGYSESELQKKTFGDITHPEERARDMGMIKKMVNGRIQNYVVEKRYITKSGKIIFIHLSATLIRDNQGQALYFLTFAEDITQHHQWLEALEKSEEKYSTISEYSSDGIVVIQDGIVRYANSAIKTIFNLHPSKVVGKSMMNFVVPEDQALVGSNYTKRINGEKADDRYEFNVIDPKGVITPVETHSALITYEGRPAVLAQLRDITRFKQIDKIKSEFISVASHQLRTPLTGIKWFAQLLAGQKASPLSSKQLSYVKQISASNERMIRLINDLIDVSHIETGQKFKVVKKTNDLVALIKQVIFEEKINMPSREVMFDCDKFCNKKIVFKFDFDKIYQALMNLVNNALKYSEPDTKIKVQLAKFNGSVRVSVKDFGYGIPDNQQSRVFNKFFRAENIMTKATEGTGLGLYITKGLIEAHGGEIWFDSVENKGTTFYFSLPVK